MIPGSIEGIAPDARGVRGYKPRPSAFARFRRNGEAGRARELALPAALEMPVHPEGLPPVPVSVPEARIENRPPTSNLPLLRRQRPPQARRRELAQVATGRWRSG